MASNFEVEQGSNKIHLTNINYEATCEDIKRLLRGFDVLRVEMSPGTGTRSGKLMQYKNNGHA